MYSLVAKNLSWGIFLTVSMAYYSCYLYWFLWDRMWFFQQDDCKDSWLFK